MLTESEYRTRTTRTLHDLLTAFDALSGDCSAELGGDVLTLEFSDGGVWVINTQAAARQVWLSAERRAWHFEFDGNQDRWLDTKEQRELWRVLTDLLTTRLKRSVDLKALAAS
jgi:CyaY protein